MELLKVIFILQVAAVANSTEYKLGLSKNAILKGEFLGMTLN